MELGVIHIKWNFLLWFLFLTICFFLSQTLGRSEGCYPCEPLKDIVTGCFMFLTFLFKVWSRLLYHLLHIHSREQPLSLLVALDWNKMVIITDRVIIWAEFRNRSQAFLHLWAHTRPNLPPFRCKFEINFAWRGGTQMVMQHIASLPWWQYHIIDAEQKYSQRGPHRDTQVLHMVQAWSCWVVCGSVSLEMVKHP